MSTKQSQERLVEILKRWQDIARDTAWKDYAAKSEKCAQLLKLAEKVP